MKNEAADAGRHAMLVSKANKDRQRNLMKVRELGNLKLAIGKLPTPVLLPGDCRELMLICEIASHRQGCATHRQ